MTRKNKPATPAEELRMLMGKHRLTQPNVAGLALVSLKTVESWLAAAESKSRRTMPERHLMLIRANLPTFLAARRSTGT